MPSPVISHIRRLPDQTWEIQSNEQHQQGVADLAAEFASNFGMRPWGRALGLLHDKGKEKRLFQD